MTRDFVILGGISLTGRFAAEVLRRGHRPRAIVLGGDDLDNEFEGLSAPVGEHSAWWTGHAFMAGAWREQLHAAAREAGVPVLSGGDPYALLPASEVLIVAGFSRRIPRSVTQRYGDWALNVHPSLLPGFGGPQPEIQTILHEQREAGVSVHTIIEQFDAGTLRAQRSFPLHDDLTVGEIEARAAVLGAECIEALLSAPRLPVVAGAGQPSYFKALPADAGNLANCRSLAHASKLLRLRPEVYAYFEHAGSTVYPLVADTRACRSPALSLPDGTLHCHEWVERTREGRVSHHRCASHPA